MTELLATPSNLGRYEIEWSCASLEELWDVAFRFVDESYPEQLDYYRDISLESLTPHSFWSEYIWCVYTSGFNASVVSKKFKDLMNAYGPWDFKQPDRRVKEKVLKIFANKRKCDAILRTRSWLRSMGWDRFREDFIASPETLGHLPFIGSVTRYHLARNIGVDCVKPDLHLVRLAEFFSMEEPSSLCEFLAGLSGERLGVVDYVLWCYCATFGTTILAND